LERYTLAMNVDIAVGSTLAGFRVERLLGRGAMGAVYLAEDVHLQRKVAIKVLGTELADDDRFRRRFLLESQLAASLEHPHIVPIYAAGEENEVLFLAMKYVEGYDLRELIDVTDTVGDERALRMLGQVGDALDMAHGLGLVHRDVKPANILIGAGPEERVYLCDFGLARHASTVASLTGNAFVGTIAYVAPEQIETGAVDARADVYSLGCVLYECLTGAAPFERDGDLQVVFAHLKEPPPLVTSLRPDLADPVDEVLQKALAKSPDERFSTCTELIAAAGEALAVTPPEISRSTRRTIPGVRTFLITDIRGYTSYTAQHGDEAAAEIASTFAEIVRQVVEEREGRLIELRGDEALVVFDSARQALRSSLEIQERVQAAKLPRGVGVGLDAGEAIPVADGYRGGALNLAARLCSLAGPGEVLASETVLQLARTVEGIHYGERRLERVKGLAKPVTAVEVLPAGLQVRRWNRRRLKRATMRSLRRRSVRLAAVATLLAAAGATAFLVLAGAGSGATTIAQQSVGFVSPTGHVEGQLPVSGSGTLGLLGGTLWFGNGDDKTVERIDPRTKELIHPFVSIQDGIADMTVGLGSVWVVDGKEPLLLRIDPRYRTIERIPLPAKRADIDFTAPTEVVVGAGSVWVAEANTVFRIDPKKLRVVRSIEAPQADLLAFGDGSLWVGSSNISSISEIDPAVNQVVKTIKLRDFVTSLAVGGGFVWATVTPDDTLWKIDENGTVEKTLDVAHAAGDVTYFDGAVWVAGTGSLQRVDPGSDGITAYPVADRIAVLAPGDGVLYVSTLRSPPPLTSLPAAKVATVSLSENWLDDTDPAHAFPGPSVRAQFEYETGAQLLNYPDAPAPRGSTLGPDVAAAMPTVSRDGRTYTFRVRPGFRFSPPSNQAVTAETFRYSIERALSSGLGAEAPGYSVLSDVSGAGAFHDGKAQHVSGITVRGDRLSIRLTAPAGDFLARLSMPFFAAVPIGTPIVNGGVQTPIPSAGPYYLKVAFEDDLRVLERNPNYHGPRPHRLDRIVYDLNNSTHRTVDRIENGDADYSADVLQESTFMAGGPLDRRFGRGHGSATTPRLVLTPQVGFRFLGFNTVRGPFADVRLRRAVGYAIDRRALAAVLGDRPSDAYLPPALQGPGRKPVYPLSANLPRARSLARGFRGTVVLYTCRTPDCTTTARIVRANLAPLGISVRIKQFEDSFGESQKRGAAYDIVLLSWFNDWPDPNNGLNLFLDPNGFRPPWAPRPISIPASYRHQLERVALLRGPARASAYRRLAATLERDVAPFAAYSTPLLPEFFSARMGCRLEQPVIGAADLGALCVTKH
jgi:ABC-type transport system substrate-binding protein/class 3 adenylate cyclase/tRNA A-37 threonylcarbamoyl transferase component Bud32